jgi:hypothetical protein
MKTFDSQKAGVEFVSSLQNVVSAMYELQRVIEGHYEGMEDIICDGFPFAESYDEQVAMVHAWLEKVREKAGK